MGKKKLNILFLTGSFYPSTGGVEKHILKLSEQLINDNHKVTVITYGTKVNNNYLIHNSIEIYFIPKKWKHLNSLNAFLFFFKNIFKLKNFDLIHVHDYFYFWNWVMPFYLYLKILRKKIYITFHGWEGRFPPRINVIIKRKIIEKISNGNICIGDFIAKWYHTKPTLVSYGAVDIENSYDFESENIFLFIGRLSNDTGILNYLNAWLLFKDSHNFCLYIAGDGELKNDIINFINKNELENIYLLGHVKDIDYFISKSKVILTSGYLSILEAFLNKKPVISFYNNPLKKDYLEMIPNSKNLFWIASDENTLTNLFSTVLNDKSKFNNALNFAKKHQWKDMKQLYYKLWRFE
jgi:glycosyltransferase involved in cell wall biosynthesis